MGPSVMRRKQALRKHKIANVDEFVKGENNKVFNEIIEFRCKKIKYVAMEMIGRTPSQIQKSNSI